MNPKDFLHTALQTISKGFPQVHIKYGYNFTIQTHIVELLPLIEYLENDSLDDAWIPLSFDFRRTFPEEEIAFISSDSKLCIKEPIFEFNASVSGFDMISEFYEPLFNTELKYSFPTEMPIKAIVVGNSINCLLRYPKQHADVSQYDFDDIYEAAA